MGAFQRRYEGRLYLIRVAPKVYQSKQKLFSSRCSAMLLRSVGHRCKKVDELPHHLTGHY